jgi:hypothetical protein
MGEAAYDAHLLRSLIAELGRTHIVVLQLGA